MGHNGAGKSTLVKLLMRFYDPNNGEIYFNDKRLCEYPLNGYRKYLVKKKLIKGRKTRTDTTVVEANIIHPMDAGLLYEGIKS